MEATVSAPLQGLRMETGWVSLTQAAGLGCVRSPLWGWEARAPTRGAPTLLGSAAMYTEGAASRPPTAQGPLAIGVQENEVCTRDVAQGPHSGPAAFQRCGFLPHR